MFRWHRDALRFLSRHPKALADRPVAIFALGPMTPGKEEEFTGAREQLDKELAKYPWFRSAAVEIFGGRFDITKGKFPFSRTLKQIPNSDLRDWEAIRTWAVNLKPLLAA